MNITIKTQAEFDKLPKSFDEFTYIDIYGNIEVNNYIANSQVTARGNSQVTAWGNSQVTARENSQVTAWGNVGVRNYSIQTVLLFGFAVAWLFNQSKAIKKSKNSTIINVKQLNWFENNAVKKTKEIVLYKRVSFDFKTQEKTKNETLWIIGSVVIHTNYNPKNGECGEGKFHACSQPYFCDEFRSKNNDKYIAIQVALKDTYTWPNPQYPYKIGFRSGKVLYQCDKFGNKINS